MTDQTTDRVADAPADIWVYRLLPKSMWPYAQLARWDRPIGWWLLLWPCWWSLALANVAKNHEILTDERVIGVYWPLIDYGFFLMLFLFLIGAISMRGAGCTYNDIVDIDFDAKVARTASRPIPSGRVSRTSAVAFLLAQAIIGFLVLYYLSWHRSEWFQLGTFGLGLLSLIVVAAYPFAKRITDWPQFVLGLAFSWGALMGWMVIYHHLSIAAILLYVGCILWTIGYDTIYAHQDKEDDALIGVRSTARLFGDKTKHALIVLYTGTLLLFTGAFYAANASWPSYLGLAIGCGHMIWQIRTLDINNADNCLALFKSNKTFGWIIFSGLVVDIGV